MTFACENRVSGVIQVETGRFIPTNTTNSIIEPLDNAPRAIYDTQQRKCDLFSPLLLWCRKPLSKVCTGKFSEFVRNLFGKKMWRGWELAVKFYITWPRICAWKKPWPVWSPWRQYFVINELKKEVGEHLQASNVHYCYYLCTVTALATLSFIY